MSAFIVQRSEKSFTVQVEVPYSKSMLEGEEMLQQCLNEAGALSSGELLQQFDTDGSNIEFGGVKFYPHGQREPKEFQSPYGAIVVQRYVYQTSAGGKRFVPLDHDARIVGTCTPKFAKMVSSKYACDGAPGVQRDLHDNHNRPIALSFIKNVSDLVGTIAIAKEEVWAYRLPEFPKAVSSISVGLDGTCLNMMEDGWREAMCGTISFYAKDGDRLHTIYTAASPEYGKAKFLAKFGSEVDKAVNLFPKKTVVGLADGAASNWGFLSKCADVLTVDFWHMSEYLAKAANAMFPGKSNTQQRHEWLEDTCHKAKHNSGAISRILKELNAFGQEKTMHAEDRKQLQTTITYLTNHKSKMQYHKNVAENLPIGSGVTEAACKAIVKNRMCKGAARWKEEGAEVVLTIRSIHMTAERWDQFWAKYSQYGHTKAA
jgi:hypothetical protein